jgi:hypothetical protein
MSEALRVLQYLEEKCGMKSNKLHAEKCEKCGKGCKCEDEDDGISRYEDPEDSSDYDDGDEDDDGDLDEKAGREMGGYDIVFRKGKRFKKKRRRKLTKADRDELSRIRKRQWVGRKGRRLPQATRVKRARTMRARKTAGLGGSRRRSRR